MKKYIITTLVALTITLTGAQQTSAGTLFPTHVPGETMYSLQEIYNLATASTTSSIGNGLPFNRPASVNGSMVTLEELYNAVLALRNASSTTGGGDDDTEIRNEYGELTVSLSSDTRPASKLKVENDSRSDLHDIISFEILAEESTVDINSIQVEIETGNANVENVAQDFILEIDGQQFDDWSYVEGASSTNATIEFTIDNGDVTLDINNTVDAVLMVVLKQLDGNYEVGETLKASIISGAVVGTDTDGVISEGNAQSNIHSLEVSTSIVEDFTWTVNNNGMIIDFFFTVTAEDEDFNVLESSVISSTSGTATTSVGILTKSTGDADVISGGYQVQDGDTARFRVRYTLTGDNGQYSEVTITSVAGQEIPDDDQVSPTATININ